MQFLVAFLLAMTLPGAGLSYILNLDTCRVAVSIALSSGVAVLVMATTRAAGLEVPGFLYGLLAAYLLIVAGVVTKWRYRRYPSPRRSGLEVVHAVPVLAIGAIGAYMLWAGPYMEIPADAWWHIGRINDRLDDVAQGVLAPISSIGAVFDKSAGYWYTLAAVFLHFTGYGIEPGLEYLALANTLLFCAGVYAFACFVFRDIVESRRMRHWVAAAGMFFFVTHFGLSVFSYVRYYAYAPTILNYVVYLGATACILGFIRRGEGGWHLLAVAAVLAIVAAMVHTQEAAFIVVMSGAMVLAEAVRLYGARPGTRGVASDAGVNRAGRRVLFLLAICLIGYVSIHSWAYLSVTRHNPLTHNLLADVKEYLPFVQNLYVLKPGKQFYQVITVWGVLVYVLFLWRFREVSRSPYLVAGMAMPVLTVFNPVFTDFFLRFSWPEVLWRMCYMLPLPLVGGYFLVRSVEGVYRFPGMLKRVGAAATAVALVALLFPVKTTYFVSPFSRIYTLAPVAEANDHRLWEDLLEFLDHREGTGIVTDPVTGYVVNGLTRHRYHGYKFRGSSVIPVNRDAYDTGDFNHREDWIVVVNRRDGAASVVGRHGRHWPENIMKVSNYYSREFLEFISEHPSLFERLWTRAGISVYRVRSVAQ